MDKMKALEARINEFSRKATDAFVASLMASLEDDKDTEKRYDKMLMKTEAYYQGMLQAARMMGYKVDEMIDDLGNHVYTLTEER